MATLSVPYRATTVDTVADLLHALGNIPAERVRWNPRPGSATEKDVLEEREKPRRLCELVDGTLVEKSIGFQESVIAVFIAYLFHKFNEDKNLGLISGADGMVRLFPGLVRIPDVAFALWRNVPGGRVPTEPIPDLVPNLVVEVVSESNTAAEMERKRKEFQKAGAQLIWIVDPQPRNVTVFEGSNAPETLTGDRELTGRAVLPGFSVKLSEIFAVLDRMQQR